MFARVSIKISDKQWLNLMKMKVHILYDKILATVSD